MNENIHLILLVHFHIILSDEILMYKHDMTMICQCYNIKSKYVHLHHIVGSPANPHRNGGGWKTKGWASHPHWVHSRAAVATLMSATVSMLLDMESQRGGFFTLHVLTQRYQKG